MKLLYSCLLFTNCIVHTLKENFIALQPKSPNCKKSFHKLQGIVDVQYKVNKLLKMGIIIVCSFRELL